MMTRTSDDRMPAHSHPPPPPPHPPDLNPLTGSKTLFSVSPVEFKMDRSPMQHNPVNVTTEYHQCRHIFNVYFYFPLPTHAHN